MSILPQLFEKSQKTPFCHFFGNVYVIITSRPRPMGAHFASKDSSPRPQYSGNTVFSRTWSPSMSNRKIGQFFQPRKPCFWGFTPRPPSVKNPQTPITGGHLHVTTFVGPVSPLKWGAKLLSKKLVFQNFPHDHSDRYLTSNQGTRNTKMQLQITDILPWLNP